MRVRDDRQQCPDRVREQHEQPGAQQDHPQRGAGGDIAPSGADGRADVLRAGGADRARAAPPPSDGADHGNEAQRVDQEQHAGAGRGKQGAADRGPDRSAQVLVDGAERDRLGPFLRRHELGLKHLPRRRGQRLPGPDRDDQRQQDRRCHQAGERQAGQQGRRREHEALRGDQQPAAIDDVAQRTGRHREQHDRQPGRGLDQGDQRRRARQRQHQLLRPDCLHLAADVAHELRRRHPREVARAKRRPC